MHVRACVAKGRARSGDRVHTVRPHLRARAGCGRKHTRAWGYGHAVRDVILLSFICGDVELDKPSPTWVWSTLLRAPGRGCSVAEAPPSPPSLDLEASELVGDGI
eukprot:365688-Chlamydomonas_euryale.AAC.9